MGKEHAKAQAVVMYTHGHMTYKQIGDILKVCKSSISEWLQDVPRRPGAPPPRKRKRIRDHRQERLDRQAKVEKKPFNNTKLKDEDVLELRQMIRQEQFWNLAKHSERLGVCGESVRQAARGQTFSHLNDQVAPITEKYPAKPRVQRKKRQWTNEVLVAEVIALRREDMTKWTYQALAQYMNDRSTRRYSAGRVASLIRFRDPDLHEKGKNEPKPPRQLYQYSRECPICDESYKTTNRLSRSCGSESCKAVLREYAHS